jgi:GNAT superfamily N-acetyltransferase
MPERSPQVVQETIDAIYLNPVTASAINRLMLATWPHIATAKEGTIDFLLQRWATYGGAMKHRPLYHLAYLDGELIGLAHTFPRTIAGAQGEMLIMGLANVCVAQQLRGRGLGRTIVRAAFDRISGADFSVSLFQTTAAVAPFYRRLGAVGVNNRVYNSLAEDPTANPFWDPVAMRYPATAAWPDSDIDLRGPGY